MFTVEFESDASVITTIDERDLYEDVEMIMGDDGTVYIRQFDDNLEQYQMLYMSSQQWLDLITAYQSPEGAYYVKVIT
jgi:hypothetical protein|tara:strand:- start:3 stop:236 length:234 start_codon:yes stop_codon:yes gene_type:complete